jgi:hypothetical protein
MAMGGPSAEGGAATIEWARGASGDWHDPSNWNPQAVPESPDAALITASGPRYLITVEAPASAGSLIVNAPVRVLLSGTLSADYIRLESGSIDFLGGTISDAVLEMTGGALRLSSSGGMLYGVTVNGDLNLGSGSGLQTLTITGGTTVTGAVNLKVPGTELSLSQSMNLMNVFNLSRGTSLNVIGAQDITLLPTFVMNMDTAYFTDQIAGGANVINFGTINGSGGFDLERFANHGTINILGEGLGQYTESFINSPTGVINILSGVYAVSRYPFIWKNRSPEV